MKTKTQKAPKSYRDWACDYTPPEFLVGVPDGPIERMEASWANDWINIYSNGGIGYQGRRMPTESEKMDIKARINKLQELLRKRLLDLDKAWWLMNGK